MTTKPGVSPGSHSFVIPAALFAIASGLSFVGAQAAVYALVIEAHGQSASPVLAGAVFFVLFVPLLALAPLLVRTASSSRRARALCAGHVLGAAMLALGVIVLPAGAGPIPRLVALAAYGVSWAFIPATRFSYIADVFPTRLVGVATVLCAVASVLALGAAPSLVEQLSPRLGLRGVIAIAASAIAIAGLVYAASGAFAGRDARRDAAPPRPLPSIFGRYQPDLLRCALAAALLGPANVLMPRYATERWGLVGPDRGLFLSALGIGLLIAGALALSPVARRLPADRVLWLALLSMLVVARVPSASGAFVAYLIAAAAAGLVLQALQRGLQERVDEVDRGALMTVVAIINQGVPGIAGLLGAALAAPLGIATATAAWSILLALGQLCIPRATSSSYRDAVPTSSTGAE